MKLFNFMAIKDPYIQETDSYMYLSQENRFITLVFWGFLDSLLLDFFQLHTKIVKIPVVTLCTSSGFRQNMIKTVIHVLKILYNEGS